MDAVRARHEDWVELRSKLCLLPPNEVVGMLPFVLWDLVEDEAREDQQWPEMSDMVVSFLDVLGGPIKYSATETGGRLMKELSAFGKQRNQAIFFLDVLGIPVQYSATENGDRLKKRFRNFGNRRSQELLAALLKWTPADGPPGPEQERHAKRILSKAHSFSEFNAMQADAVLAWLLYVANWNDRPFGPGAEALHSAIAYWEKFAKHAAGK
jgi:hypothetical protein